MTTPEEENKLQQQNEANNNAVNASANISAQQKKVGDKITGDITAIFTQGLEDYKKKVKIDNQSPEQIFSGVIKHLEETGKGDMVSKMKTSLGLQATDNLTFEHVKNVKIGYEKTADALTNTLLDSTIPKTHNTAIAKTYLTGFKDLLSKENGGKQIFSSDVKSQFKKHVEDYADKIESIADLKFYINNFLDACKNEKIVLSEKQIKDIQNISISFSSIQQSMLDLGLATKQEIANMNRDKVVGVGSQAELLLGSVAKLYGVTKLKDTLNSAKQATDAWQGADKLPGLAKKLASYELDDDALIENDEEFEKKLADPDMDEVQKNKFRIIAAIKAIKKKDPSFGAMMQELVDQDFVMTKVSTKTQQAYMNIMKDQWVESTEGKDFISGLSGTNVSKEQMTSIVDQLFDLSKKDVTLKNKDGEDITLGVEKHWINEPWNARTSEAFMKNGFPLVFEVSGVDDAMLASMAGKNMKDFQNNPTNLLDAEGKKVEVREGNYVELFHEDSKTVEKGYLKKTSEGYTLLQNPGDTKGKELNHSISQYVVQNKKDTVIAGPEKLSGIAGAVAVMHQSSEMTDQQHKDAQDTMEKEFLQEKLVDEYTGIDESKKVNSSNVDDIDRKNKEEVEKLTEGDIKNAEAYTKKDIHDLKEKIAEIESDIKNKDAELRVLNERINDPQNKSSDSDKAMLVQKKKALENERKSLEKQKRAAEAAIVKDQERLADIKKYEDEKEKKQAEIENSVSPEAVQQAAKDIANSAPLLSEKSDDKKMKEVWKNLQGDVDAPLEAGVSFFVELGDAKSVLPGWKHPWAKATILDYNEGDGSMNIKWTGVEEQLEGIEGKTSIVYGDQGFDELKGKVGSIIKLPKYPNGTKRNERGVKLKGANFAMDKEHKDYITSLMGNVDFGSWYRKKAGEVDKTNKTNQIRYIGSTTETLETEKKDGGEVTSIKTKKLWYEIVDQNDTSVTIKGKRADGSEYKRTMDPDSFLMFMMDKGLVTYTQSEVDKINEGKKPAGEKSIFDDIQRDEEPGSKSKMKWTNIGSVIHAWKFATDGVKKYFKDDQKHEDEELQNIMLGSKWFKSLSKLKPAILGDAFDEMSSGHESKMDNKKVKEIEEAMKEPKDNGKANSAGWTVYIKETLLDSIAAGDYSFAKKYPRKAAGYYLATLDGANNPYPRALSGLAGKGYWVGAILGPSYQKQYLTRYANLKHYCEQNPSDTAEAEKLARGELQFMKITYGGGSAEIKSKMDKDFGSSFFTKMLGMYEGKQFNTSKINDAKDGGKFKGFSQLYNDDFFGPLEQNRTPDMIGTLDIMGDKIKGNTLHYRQWNMCMALPILMGQPAAHMNEDYKNHLVEIARKFACPFGLYGKQTDGQKKLRDLFALVEEEAGCSKFFSQTPPPQVNSAFPREVEKRWFGDNGQKMLKYLTDPGKLIACRSALENNLKSENDSAKRQNIQNKINILTDYVDNKCLDEERGRIGDIKGESIIYEKHIMVLSPGFVSNHMLGSYERGYYKSDKIEYAPKLWNALNKKIAGYSNEKVPPELYEYVLKKFVDYFGAGRYIGLDKLQTAIKYSNKDNTDALNVAISMVFNQSGNDLPAEVADCFRTFEMFFAKEKPTNPEDLYKIFGRVFGKEKGTETYFNKLKPNNIKTNTKQEQKNIQDQVISKLNREHQVNTSTDGTIEVLRRGNGFCDQTGRELTFTPPLGTLAVGKKGKNTTYRDQDDKQYKDLDPANMQDYYDRDREALLLAQQRAGLLDDDDED